MKERSEQEVQARIEAALYVAGRPLDPGELARAAGITSKRAAVRAARSLMKRILSVLRAVQIVELPDQRFVMQLQPGYASVAKRFATRPLLPSSAMKTLSYVAFFQPITAQEMAGRRGLSVYSHLKLLSKHGFVTSESAGRTRIYRTTRGFAEYFGLSEDPEEMKKQLIRMKRLPTGSRLQGF